MSHGAMPLASTDPDRHARRLVAAFALVAAAACGPFAGLLANGTESAFLAAAALGAGAIALRIGLARLDLALLTANFAAIAFFTAIRHRSTVAIDTAHPFYEWTLFRITLPELLALAALLLTLLRGRTPTHERATPGAAPGCFLAFLALACAVGLARGTTLEACVRDGRKIAYVAVAHFLVVAIAAAPARRERLLQGVALALLAGGVATMVDWWASRGFHYRGFVRASVDVSDFLGSLALIAVPLALLRLGVARSRVACLLAVAVGAIATLCSFSRAAWCASPIALAVVLLHPARTTRPASRWLTLLIAAAALAAPLLFSGVADQAFARFSALFDPAGDPSVTYRVRELRGAAALALDHPLTGVGLGTQFDVAPALVDRRRNAETLVHHLFLWSALKAGLPGLLLVGGALTAVVVSLSRSARRCIEPRHAALALGLLGLLVGFIVIGQIGAMLNQARTAFLLGAVTGLARTLAVARERPALVDADGGSGNRP